MERQLTILRGADGSAIVRLGGRFRISDGLAATDALDHLVEEEPPPRHVAFDTAALQDWDSALVAALAGFLTSSVRRGVLVDTSGLPIGARRLLELLESAPAAPARTRQERSPWLARIGELVLGRFERGTRVFELIGRTTFAIGHLGAGRARIRREDVMREMAGAGAEALPIVSVVSILLGMILAFVGSVTLKPFGASIYVARVVTVGMVRELGAVMTAIVMAGRTGSAYASELSTMNVTQETDALVTLGIEPVDFLVLPRMLALSLMMPVLYLYANAVAMVGGGIVALGMLGLTPALYVQQSRISVPLYTVLIGVVKSGVFGVLVALAGCSEGMHSGRSAADVGRAATGAVVLSIVWIIAADGVAAVLLHVLGL
jgi:phospholipid/cholesterol/gamma-HCH transport system permease protein